MMTTKKCAICGYKFSFDNELRTNLLISDKNVGAKGYFDLWHFFIEKCPKCGYMSADISVCKDKKAIRTSEYKLDDVEMIEKLEEARPNQVADYLYGAKYYEGVGDKLNEAKCIFQSADLVYGELIYWEEYILDEEDLDNDPDYMEIEGFAEELFARGLKVLDEHIDAHPNDYDAKILYAGICSDGGSVQKVQGIRMLKALLVDTNLTEKQKAMVEYLLKDI